jgi:hypothetical protein
MDPLSHNQSCDRGSVQPPSYSPPLLRRPAPPGLWLLRAFLRLCALLRLHPTCCPPVVKAIALPPRYLAAPLPTAGLVCDRTTSKMKGLSPKIILGDSRRSENAQTHTSKHTIPNMKFKLKLLQIKCHVLGFTKR